MANPAILAGLIAGYTVGAVVTALAVARDDRPQHRPVAPRLASASPATPACARAARGRNASRCLRPLGSRPLSSPRR